MMPVFFVLGCRGIESEPGRQYNHSLFPGARTDREWYPKNSDKPLWRGRVDLGPIDPSIIVDHMLQGPRERYNINIAPDDTLSLYAKWTGRSVQELLKKNPAAQRHGLVSGEGFHLLLTPGEFARFNGSRKAYLAAVKTRREQGVEVIDVKFHRVRDGETLRSILDRYGTDMDLLEKFNPRVRLSGIHGNQVLNIPIVAPSTADKPSMPGPKPPAPLPVPRPPEEQRPVTVDSDPKAYGDHYVVRSGDTAWDVARSKLHVSLDALGAANPEINLDDIRPGMRLTVPE